MEKGGGGVKWREERMRRRMRRGRECKGVGSKRQIEGVK